MKRILLTELNKEIDITKLNSLIVSGKPKKLLGFINNGYEDIGLFKPIDQEGNNIVHSLVLAANKNVLAHILPEIYKNALQICQREKISEPPINFLGKFIDARNIKGFKPAHIAIDQGNPAALDILRQHGVVFTARSEGTYSPIEYIFIKKPQFLNEVIKGGFVHLLELICTQATEFGILEPSLPAILAQTAHMTP
jgi:hypothetical protein